MFLRFSEVDSKSMNIRKKLWLRLCFEYILRSIEELTTVNYNEN
jgi:hypothetical protein